MRRELRLERRLVVDVDAESSDSGLFSVATSRCARAISDGEGRAAGLGDEGTRCGGSCRGGEGGGSDADAGGGVEWGCGGAEMGNEVELGSSSIPSSSIVTESSSELPGSSSELMSSSESRREESLCVELVTGSSREGAISSWDRMGASRSRSSLGLSAMTRASSSRADNPPCRRPSAS